MSAHPSTVQALSTSNINPISENADNTNAIIRGSAEVEANIVSENYNNQSQSSSLNIIFHRILGVLNWVPPSCRYDPKNPREFTLALNLLFGFAGTFTVRFSLPEPIPALENSWDCEADQVFRSQTCTTHTQSSMYSPKISMLPRNEPVLYRHAPKVGMLLVYCLYVPWAT